MISVTGANIRVNAGPAINGQTAGAAGLSPMPIQRPGAEKTTLRRTRNVSYEARNAGKDVRREREERYYVSMGN